MKIYLCGVIIYFSILKFLCLSLTKLEKGLPGSKVTLSK